MSEFVTHMCAACAAGIFEECENATELEPGWIIPCAQKFSMAAGVVGGPTERGLVGRPPLDPSQVTDPKSTGRKRAKMLAPISTGQLCEWADLKRAGGGVVPILGCQGNRMIEKKGGEDGYVQGDRHHGPDKGTMNNRVGVNLHSICVTCHHRWHALNDPFYDDEGRPAAEFAFLPVEPYYSHDPNTTFTDDEWAEAELWWSQKPFDRGPYPYAPDESVKKVLPIPADFATLEPGENPFPDSPFAENGDLS
tara:strand:- start:41165 stop:41917 length:753 start_codon:yes stop_codon:yes gene_type:complete